MITNGTSILEFLPQRPPVVMIDKLISADGNKTVSGLLVKKSNIFFDQGGLSESGLVENIAQTAAMHVGYQCSLKNIPIPIGYIAAVKDLKIQALPRQNSRISTTVTITNKVLDVTVVEGRVEQEGNLLCSCEMRIFAKINAKT